MMKFIGCEFKLGGPNVVPHEVMMISSYANMRMRDPAKASCCFWCFLLITGSLFPLKKKES